MKIVIFSDSHGNCANMRETLKKEAPQMVFYLGDGLRDIETVMREFPELPLHSVAGNCDLCSHAPTEELVVIQNIPMLLCHGHTHYVKYGYESYIFYGIKRGIKILFAGHTHKPRIEEDRGILLINPGSVGYYYAPTYAVLELADGEIVSREIRQVEHPVFEQ